MLRFWIKFKDELPETWCAHTNEELVARLAKYLMSHRELHLEWVTEDK